MIARKLVSNISVTTIPQITLHTTTKITSNIFAKAHMKDLLQEIHCTYAVTKVQPLGTLLAWREMFHWRLSELGQITLAAISKQSRCPSLGMCSAGVGQ